jgi:hypothetical protein
MASELSVFVFTAVVLAFLAGVFGERVRARLARRRWKPDPRRTATVPVKPSRFQRRRLEPEVPLRIVSSPSQTHGPRLERDDQPRMISAPSESQGPQSPEDQLRIVSKAKFAPRRLLSKSETRVFLSAEKAIKEGELPWRAMAQVCLGEVLWSADARAFGAINSKRVDVLLVDENSHPVAAIEYQGSGHYQGSAPARDAVKKEALRRAGVRYIEISTDHRPKDLAAEIARIAAVRKLKASASG